MYTTRAVVRRNFSLRRGFTLIELLVVIAIISILTTIVLASITASREKARDTARLASINKINTAIIAYQSDYGVPPGEDGAMYVNGTQDWIPGLVPGYMNSLPIDPINTTMQSFRYMRQGNEYGLIARLEREDHDSAQNDGGLHEKYYEMSSGEPFTLADIEASDWRFTAATKVVSHLSCPNPGGQVTLCHVSPGNSATARTIQVGCTAVGPEGHSNHDDDYLGTCNGDEGVEEPPPLDDEAPLDCLVVLTPNQGDYTSGSPVQLSWDKNCYPSTRVLLEVRKKTDAGSSPYIMIYSAAPNTGTYPYQGFPSGLVGTEQWVVRVTNDNPRTILNESLPFTVTSE